MPENTRSLAGTSRGLNRADLGRRGLVGYVIAHRAVIAIAAAQAIDVFVLAALVPIVDVVAIECGVSGSWVGPRTAKVVVVRVIEARIPASLTTPIMPSGAPSTNVRRKAVSARAYPHA
jgi:hypothetical protein